MLSQLSHQRHRWSCSWLMYLTKSLCISSLEKEAMLAGGRKILGYAEWKRLCANTIRSDVGGARGSLSTTECFMWALEIRDVSLWC